MIGCQVCRKEVSSQPPVRVCPHCGAPMYYVPLGFMNFIGEIVYKTVKVTVGIIAAVVVMGIIVAIV